MIPETVSNGESLAQGEFRDRASRAAPPASAPGGERRGPWMRTASGGRFYPLDPRAEDVRLEDIATALSRICRYGGHTPYHYSVADHSLLVMALCPPHLKLWGLLHDAAEAYLGDVIRPLKAHMQIEWPRHRTVHYAHHELDVLTAIAEAVGIQTVAFFEVKPYDDLALAIETGEFGWDCSDWAPLPVPTENQRSLFYQRETGLSAEFRFLQALHSLGITTGGAA